MTHPSESLDVNVNEYCKPSGQFAVTVPFCVRLLLTAFAPMPDAEPNCTTLLVLTVQLATTFTLTSNGAVEVTVPPANATEDVIR